MWVVLYHAELWLLPPALPLQWLVLKGYLGVDIFFVLSGFIISTIYRDIKIASVPSFLLKRAFRLYPLHWCILALLVIKVVLTRNPSPEFSAYFSWSMLAPVTLLVHSLLGYYNYWNEPSWSIGVEILSYCIFALTAPVLTTLSTPNSVWLLLVAASGLAISLYASRHGVGLNPDVGRGVCGFVLGCAIRNLVDPADVRKNWLARLLSLPPLYWLGEISYSIYLLHGPVMSISLHAIPLLARHVSPLASSRLILAASLVIILGASHLTYHAIERPSRNLYYRLRKSRFLARTA